MHDRADYKSEDYKLFPAHSGSANGENFDLNAQYVTQSRALSPVSTDGRRNSFLEANSNGHFVVVTVAPKKIEGMD